jgi:hypothetical protein
MAKKTSNPELQSEERDIPDALKQPTPTPTPKTNGGIAPVAVGDPDNIDEFAIPQDHLEEFANPGTESAVVECRRPPRGIFFTVKPEDRGYFWILEIEGRDPFIVAPAIAKAKIEEGEEDVLRPTLLVRFITMDGSEGLWPLRLNPSDGRANTWNTSALNILELASGGKWVRIVSSKKQKSYRYQQSKKTFEECPPKFSKRTFKELRDSAFQDRIIDTLDHPIWTDLKEGTDK